MKLYIDENTINLICQSCEKTFFTHASLNKHISTCEKYPEWIKTYIPPTYVSCSNCEVKFINNMYLLLHKCIN